MNSIQGGSGPNKSISGIMSQAGEVSGDNPIVGFTGVNLRGRMNERLKPITRKGLRELIENPSRETKEVPTDKDELKAFKETLPYIWPGGESLQVPPVFMHCLSGDLDKHNPQKAWLIEILKALGVPSFMLHTTTASKPDDLRWRLFVPLAQPVEVALWAGLQKALKVALSGDKVAFEIDRVMYLPCRTPDYDFHIEEGDLLSVYLGGGHE